MIYFNETSDFKLFAHEHNRQRIRLTCKGVRPIIAIFCHLDHLVALPPVPFLIRPWLFWSLPT